MVDLDHLARIHHCLEATDTNAFQRRARILQSMWRKAQGRPIGEYRERPIGSYLPMPLAEDEMANFLDDDIVKVVRSVLARAHTERNRPLIERTRLFSNLLSSQPLAFNLFAHLYCDLDMASTVLRAISRGRIEQVLDIDFEYSPGRGNPRYTGDHSAFDVYVRFLTPKEKEGFAGIEVKYHENLSNNPSRHHPRYDEIANQMSCFLPEARWKLRKRPLQQIWRDHLLAGAHRVVDGFADGFFVFLCPRDNPACNRAVMAYKQCLRSEETFIHWTLESLVDVLRNHCTEPWVEKFADRYLAFEKVDRGDH